VFLFCSRYSDIHIKEFIIEIHVQEVEGEGGKGGMEVEGGQRLKIRIKC